jgi:hypothetical protein
VNSRKGDDLRFEVREIVTVYANTVRVGDIVRVGAVDRRVRDMRAQHGSAKLLIFSRGETFTLGASASLLAYRKTSITIG